MVSLGDVPNRRARLRPRRSSSRSGRWPSSQPAGCSHGGLRESIRDAGVLGDPVFGILVLADRKSELTEEVVRQPTIDEMLSHKARHLRSVVMRAQTASGLTPSAWNPRFLAAMMASGSARQVKGSGVWLCSAMKRLIVA